MVFYMLAVMVASIYGLGGSGQGTEPSVLELEPGSAILAMISTDQLSSFIQTLWTLD